MSAGESTTSTRNVVEVCGRHLPEVPMNWVNGVAAWEAKCLWIESAHRLAESGRICSEIHCTARSEMAFPVERAGWKWEAGFCGAHAVVFASSEHEGYTVGVPRRLEDDEALAGPLAQGEDDERSRQDEPDLDY